MHTLRKWSLLVLLFLLTAGMPPARANVSAQEPTADPSTTINSALAIVPPVIDGSIGSGEWHLGNRVTFDRGFMVAANDGIRLYILLNLTGDTGDDAGIGDFFWVTFDVDRDGAIDPNLDLNYGLVPSTGNMRYQYYLGPGQWTGLQPNTRSSRAKGFGCFFADGTLTVSTSPFWLDCQNHRVWELAFDLAEIGAAPGQAVRMGFRVTSGNPTFTVNVPTNFTTSFASLITVNLSTVTLPSSSRGASIRWETDPMEFTQAIQTRTNTLPLVQDKDTVARLYVDVQGANSQPVVAYLYGTVGGVDLPGSPLATLYTAPSIVTRGSLDATANFLLPSAWDQGTVTFRGRARMLSSASEIATAETAITFNVRRRPTYWYLPLNIGSASSPWLINTTEMDRQRSYLEAIYPVPSVSWVLKPWTAVGVTTVANSIAALNNYYNSVFLAWITSVFLTGNPPFPLPEQIYGFTPTGGGLSDPVWEGGAARVARGFRGTSAEGTMAHEINHNLDRSSTGTWGRHVPGGCSAGGPDSAWPYANDDIQEVGFDTRRPWMATPTQRTVVLANAPDIMSYCQSGYLPTKWISPYRWTNLFDVFAPPTGTELSEDKAQFQTVFYISGEIHRSGRGVLYPVLIQPGIPSPRFEAGSGELRIVGAQGTLLRFLFPVEFLDDPEEPVETVHFNFQLPYVRGATKIVLLHNGQEIADIPFSPNPPTVRVTSPKADQVFEVARPMPALESYRPTETLRIAWAASDPDGDPLRFTILYSPDNGQSWYPVAWNVEGNSYELDLNLIPGGRSAKLRVIVTDGVNTAQDDSDGIFAVGNHAPLVTAVAPPIAPPNQPITLTGEAVDPEDGALPEGRMVWTEGSTALGLGRTLQVVLPPGLHTLTLTAADSAGLTAQTSVSVFVGYRTYAPLIQRR
ncbi:MAG: hypothetical protein NZ528_07680 [Caldilineales bacterium]|nr:hypothetical protein [Caldilineales bacterium]